MADEIVVKTENAVRRFGGTIAVDGLNLEVQEGTVYGFLGRNAAGKTTTIKMLTTLLPIDTGSATIVGLDVAARPDAVRRVIGLAGQAAAVDEKLTARENLEMFGRLYKIPKADRRQRIDHLIERFDLGEFADRIAETYSGGQRRRLDVVASLIAAPPVLFLDEPTTGLDPRSRAELWGEIEDLAAQGTAVVLTTQYLDEADRLSDRIVIIDEGVMKASGTSAELKTNLERDVFEVHVALLEDVGRAVEVTERVAPGVSSDTADLLLQIPLTDGSSQSLAVLRELDTAGVAISDFQLRRPTLDDVFLTITATGGNR